VAGFHKAFNPLHFTVEDIIAEGDKVVVRWTNAGTDSGGFMGIPPTGRKFGIAGIDIHRVRDGRLAEHWARGRPAGADMIAERDIVVVQWSHSGTHRGAFLVTPPSGKPFTLIGIDVDRIRGGNWPSTGTSWTMFGFYQQIGLTLGPAVSQA
jgi:predicted ester cyclase